MSSANTYDAADKIDLDLTSLTIPCELEVEFQTFAERKIKDVDAICQRVLVTRVISPDKENETKASGQEFDVLTFFGDSSRINLNTLKKAFAAGGFEGKTWVPKTSTPPSLMLARGLKYLTLHNRRAIGKLAPHNDKVYFNIVSLSNTDENGEPYPDVPELVTNKEVLACWDEAAPGEEAGGKVDDAI